MANDDIFILVKIKRRIAGVLSKLIKGLSAESHFMASKHPAGSDKARELRDQGNDIHDVAKAIEAELNRRE